MKFPDFSYSLLYFNMNHKSLFYLQHILNKEAFLSYNQKFLQETAMMQVNPNNDASLIRDVALFVLLPVL